MIGQLPKQKPIFANCINEITKTLKNKIVNKYCFISLFLLNIS